MGEVYYWSSLIQLASILVIIVLAFVCPEPKYMDYPRVGTWTREMSFASFNNKLIYKQRAVKRGVLVGLVFGCIAGLITALVNMVR